MIVLAEAYKEVLETPKTEILLYGGRAGGKSNNTAIIAVLLMLQNPYTDVIIARASYGSMADSSYEEFDNALKGMGDEIYNLFRFKRSPLRIERKDGSGIIYFFGYGGSNMSRTKSIRTKHPVICVIFEETQELKEKRSLDEALGSFRRRYCEKTREIIMGNPPPADAHWFNLYILSKKHDKDWLVKQVTYLDVLNFLNDFDLREIIKTKVQDPDYYNWFYMGLSGSGMCSCFPMFRENRHVLSCLTFDRLKSKYPLRIVACVIGGDGAVNRDATSFVPLLILNNGQAVVAPIFYHDPKNDGQVSYHQLCQDHVSRWLDELCRRYHLGSINEIRQHPEMERVPIFMRIDSAAPDLVMECKFFFGERVDIAPIHKKGIMEMVGIVQSAISNDNIMVLDYGGYFDYVQNRWINKETNLLAEQLKSLIWNDKQNAYDPIIPNDVSDAFTYGCIFWYGNQENIQYFNILKARNLPNMLINDILKNE